LNRPRISERLRNFTLAVESGQTADELRLTCYHYPEIGFEVVDKQTGKLGYVDLQDGRFFEVTESGPEQPNKETREPYSLYARIQESGNPGEFDAPQDEKTIPGMSLIPQTQCNWCTAASCQMILKFYGFELEQSALAAFMNIPRDCHNGGADLYAQRDALSHFSNGSLHPVIDTNPLGSECVTALVQNRPLKNGLYQHATVCAGWKKLDGVVQYLIYDPLPMNVGSIHYQNPYIIYSINFIITPPQ
jgi:hypothetical protein